MDSVFALQVGSAVLLNAAFAWLLGSWLARPWLFSAGDSRMESEGQLRLLDIAAAALGVLATGAALWASTAVMGGVGLFEARDLFWQMLTTTSVGRSGYVSLGAITLVLVVRTFDSTSAWREWTVLATLGVFAFVRASMGHAGENGYWTVPFASEVVHVSAMGAWTGLVAVSVLRGIGAPTLQPDLKRIAIYLDLMSATATAAVAAVFITGLFNAWHRVGTFENLFDNSVYTTALIVKVGLVCVALVLGGYNKFFGLAHARSSAQGLERVKFVLKVESFVLLAVLIAAAVLTSQQPPSAM
jgi:putative copper resistance protein D